MFAIEGNSWLSACHGQAPSASAAHHRVLSRINRWLGVDHLPDKAATISHRQVKRKRHWLKTNPQHMSEALE